MFLERNCMKLRHKLLTAFLIIILLPCSMIGTIGSVILAQQVQAIEDGYQINTDNWEIVTEPIQILNRMTRGTFNELSTMAERYPERFLDKKRLNMINTSLLERYSYLIVEKNNQVFYVGEELHYNKIKNQIPSVNIMEVTYDGGVYVEGKYPFLAKQQRFVFQSGEVGSFCIITDVNSLVVRLRSATMLAIVTGIMIIVFTASILVVWLYQSMIKPLNALRRATQQLQEGNLDYSLQDAISDDEIGQLCSDFEEMRIHLKEQIEMRIRYEQDLRELISNISHDIKTPLTAIKGYAEGMIDGVADTKEKQEKYLRIINKHSSDLLHYFNQLLFLSETEMRAFSTDVKFFDIENAVLTTVKTCEQLYPEKQLDISTVVDEDLRKTIYSDEKAFKLMFQTLFETIMRSADIGAINVSMKNADEELLAAHNLSEYKGIHIQITNNSNGILESEIPTLFNPYSVVDNGNKRTIVRSISLASVKNIMNYLHGLIWAETEPLKGTVFNIVIPFDGDKHE